MQKPNVAATSVNFNPPATTALGGFPNFPGGFSFPPPAKTTAPGALNFAAPATLSFAPKTAPNFNPPSTETKTQLTTCAAATTTTTAAVAATAASNTTTSVLPPVSVPAPASAPVMPQISMNQGLSFTQLEDMINKWTGELGDLERLFLNQATQINAWDNLLATNCVKLSNLNNSVERVKSEQKKINYDLDFILAQQKELDACLQPLEKEYTSSIYTNDVQRERIYFMAENIDSQLKRMSEDLKETIEHINETSRAQESVDPVLQIGKILNAHMNSLQWIDESTTKLQSQLEQINKSYESFKRNNDRFDVYY